MNVCFVFLLFFCFLFIFFTSILFFFVVSEALSVTKAQQWKSKKKEEKKMKIPIIQYIITFELMENV